MQIQKEKHALGACSRGRAFLFGFIRRQPYMKQTQYVYECAWRSSTAYFIPRSVFDTVPESCHMPF